MPLEIPANYNYRLHPRRSAHHSPSSCFFPRTSRPPLQLLALVLIESAMTLLVHSLCIGNAVGPSAGCQSRHPTHHRIMRRRKPHRPFPSRMSSAEHPRVITMDLAPSPRNTHITYTKVNSIHQTLASRSRTHYAVGFLDEEEPMVDSSGLPLLWVQEPTT
jgi:hypothetical protein